MKKLFLYALAALLLAACATSRLTPQERAAKAAEQADRVAEAIANRHFTIALDYVMPQRGASRRISYGYELTVHGDSIDSYLPYFGRAYRVPYGGGKALNFKAVANSYRSTRVKRDLTRIEIAIRNEEDDYLYIIDVFDNGKATLEVQARERERIGFSGEMIFSKEGK
jgi:hypothetical protein